MTLNKVALPDTNTILRYLLNDHPEFSPRAVDFWESVREGHIVATLTEGVLLECVHVLQRFYKVPRTKIADELAIILSYKGLRRNNRAPFLKALAIYRAHNLDFVDCMLIARQLAGEGTVFSFDMALAKTIDILK
jgi:predicted nucleic acid-binding protein